jgi:hypothetical protein
MKARFLVAAAISLLAPQMAQAAEIRLLGSAALKYAYLELFPQFEQATGHKVTAACRERRTSNGAFWRARARTSSSWASAELTS